MNKGWPSMLWTLYNNDGDQAGSYFGAQEANRSLHAIYALDNGTVTLDNLGNTTQSGLSVEAKVYNLAGTVLDDQTASNITLASQQVLTGVLTPTVPTQPGPDLLRGTPAQAERHPGRPQRLLAVHPAGRGQLEQDAGPAAGHASPSTRTSPACRRCRTSSVSATASTVNQAGPDGADRATTVTITNTSSSTVAFLLRADVRRGTAGGQELSGDNELQSSLWQNNDITLFPGESQTLTVTWNSADLQGATAVVSVSGWNVPKIDILA